MALPPPLKLSPATGMWLSHTMEAQMTVKTTLSFTDRHHYCLAEKVGQGIFATQSAAALE